MSSCLALCGTSSLRLCPRWKFAVKNLTGNRVKTSQGLGKSGRLQTEPCRGLQGSPQHPQLASVTHATTRQPCSSATRGGHPSDALGLMVSREAESFPFLGGSQAESSPKPHLSVPPHLATLVLEIWSPSLPNSPSVNLPWSRSGPAGVYVSQGTELSSVVLFFFHSETTLFVL